MDENIFIYFETMDMCARFKKDNMKMYICEKIKFEHFGSQSHDIFYDHEAKLSRNWHYNWSKFYFFKKHYNYFYALKKILPNLLRAIKSYFRNIFSSSEENRNKKILASYELKGIFAAIMLKKSEFRIKF